MQQSYSKVWTPVLNKATSHLIRVFRQVRHCCGQTALCGQDASIAG